MDKQEFYFLFQLLNLRKILETPQKVAYLWQLGGFFSLQPRLPKTAQNSPELHFRFINSFIQSSLLRSLAETLDQMCQTVSYRYRDLNTVTATLVAFSSYRLFSGSLFQFLLLHTQVPI